MTLWTLELPKRPTVRWTEVYNASTGSIGLASAYKKQADLTLVSPDQSSVRVWKFLGVYPERFKHGPFDMTTNDKVNIEMTLSIDKVIPGTGFNSGLGSINVGSTTIPI